MGKILRNLWEYKWEEIIEGMYVKNHIYVSKYTTKIKWIKFYGIFKGKKKHLWYLIDM